MNEIPPSLRVWSGNTTNQCLSEEIPVYWEANDVVTFLADLGMYDSSLYDLLDNNEKEREQKFKTDYFKRRFTVSRSLLKYILQPILGADKPSDILLGKEKKGRVIIPRRPDICISLSYSGQYVAITVGKQKIGCDIEVVRPVKADKITSCPLFINYNNANDGEYLWKIIHVWTLVESCAKLFNTNSYSLLNSCALFKDVNFVSYCVNKHLILSIASGKRQFADALVWLDIDGSKIHPIAPKTA
jgi:4'-phosphopantetheinyl transferase